MKFRVSQDSNIVDTIFQKTGTSKTKIKSLLKYSKVKVNEETVLNSNYIVKANDNIEINYDRGRFELSKYSFRYPVLFEDDCFIVSVKPAGLLTIGTVTEKTKTFYRYMNDFVKEKSRNKERVFIVHRLDKEVSGILIFAKNETVQEAIKENWSTTKKLYYALVEGCPAEEKGTVESYLREGYAMKMYSTNNPEGAKNAITHYEIVKKYENNTLLRVQLGTGRKNQIRVHLSDIGCPIVGDIRYGADDKISRKIRLHAYYFEFEHPVTHEVIKIETPIPDNFIKLGNKDEKY